MAPPETTFERHLPKSFIVDDTTIAYNTTIDLVSPVPSNQRIDIVGFYSWWSIQANFAGAGPVIFRLFYESSTEDVWSDIMYSIGGNPIFGRQTPWIVVNRAGVPGKKLQFRINNGAIAPDAPLKAGIILDLIKQT